jgi:hypothetical protein
MTVGSFRIFRKFVEIFTSQGAPLHGINDIPVVNFPTGTACVIDTGENLPQVLMIPDSVNDAGGNLPKTLAVN